MFFLFSGEGESNIQMMLPPDHISWDSNPEPCDILPNIGASNNSQQSVTHNNWALEYSFKCEICGAAFMNKFHLGRHRVKHSPETLTCSKCSKKFANKKYLKQHMRVVHESRTFKCRGCNQLFQTKQTMKQHQARCKNVVAP